MKKVLLAFDGTNFSEGAFEFARTMNEFSPVLITGVFLPQVDYSSLWGYAAIASAGMVVPALEQEAATVIEKNIERFKFLCELNRIEYRIHKEASQFTLPQLQKETRFADLLILGSESFYEYTGTGEPNSSLKDAIHNSECPVLIVPEHFEFPDRNILAYDGSEAGVYAIKQFAYLLPELTVNATMLLYVSAEEEITFPEEINIEELCGRHFPDLNLFKLKINARKHFATWISENPGAILVCGAFGRSPVSMLYRKSFVSDVIRDHKLPVFIAKK